MSTILITGGTGFIGSAIVKSLVKSGHTVLVISRSPQSATPQKNVHFISWPENIQQFEGKYGHITSVINLAGDPINKGRWTEQKKQSILNSRVNVTRKVVELIAGLSQKPEALISASAIGYYGFSEERIFSEEDRIPPSHFLTKISEVWEKEALRAEEHGVRVVLARIGIVLGKNGGALQPMALPYKFFIGGTVASGRQWLSWIHIQDVVHLMHFLMEQSHIHGPVNFTAPQPMQMKAFGEAIGEALGRPHWIPVPSFALKILFGEMSDLLTQGQHVQPTVALKNGYDFQYRDVRTALHDIFGK